MPEEHHLAGVAKPRQGPLGGVVLVQMVPAGGALARIILAGAVLAQTVLAGGALAQMALAGGARVQMAPAGVVLARIILAGEVLAQIILAGDLVPITTRNLRTDGRMCLMLPARKHYRLSGIPRQRSGVPLAMGGGPS